MILVTEWLLSMWKGHQDWWVLLIHLEVDAIHTFLAWTCINVDFYACLIYIYIYLTLLTCGIFDNTFLLKILSFVLHGSIFFFSPRFSPLEPHLKCQEFSELHLWFSFSFHIFFSGWQCNLVLKSIVGLRVRETLNITSDLSALWSWASQYLQSQFPHL